MLKGQGNLILCNSFLFLTFILFSHCYTSIIYPKTSRMLLNKCTNYNIKRFIFASSTVVIGGSDGGDETTECHPYPYGTLYFTTLLTPRLCQE